MLIGDLWQGRDGGRAQRYPVALSNDPWNIHRDEAHSGRRVPGRTGASAPPGDLSAPREAGAVGDAGRRDCGSVGISATNTSFHLKELERAGLLRATRRGRQIIYAVHVEGMRKLLTYLTEDCCQGRPELCGAAFAADKVCRVTKCK